MTTAKGWLGVMQQASNYNHAMTPLIIKYGEMLVEENLREFADWEEKMNFLNGMAYIDNKRTINEYLKLKE